MIICVYLLFSVARGADISSLEYINSHKPSFMLGASYIGKSHSDVEYSVKQAYGLEVGYQLFDTKFLPTIIDSEVRRTNYSGTELLNYSNSSMQYRMGLHLIPKIIPNLFNYPFDGWSLLGLNLAAGWQVAKFNNLSSYISGNYQQIGVSFNGEHLPRTFFCLLYERELLNFDTKKVYNKTVFLNVKFLF
ncbi:MAG: hypothetical protein A2X86_19740 [Bdellovibrionales bacterium GWA2_49_15]|nr:MAG: hypothetical protein A2X86_19740 [Bdellovibrionales bacterium GWA2_49_15]